MLIAAGIALIVLAAIDLVLTVLHPTLRGPISYVVTRGSWVTTRGLGRLLGRHAVISLAAPVAMIAQFLAWVSALWVGFALVYLQSVDRLSYAPTVEFGETDLSEALYLSATSLTTVGFGDVVAASDTLRLVTVLEAASGLAVITAAITYLISVYPLVSELNSAARVAAEQGDEARPAKLVLYGGTPALTDLHARLIRVHQDTKRFPILYYFHAGDEAESLVALLRGSVLVCAHLRWSVDPAAVPSSMLYGPDMQQTLERIMNDYARRFLGPRRAAPEMKPLDDQEARRRLARLRATLAEVDAGAILDGDADAPGFADFIGRSDAFLDDMARRHEYPYQPLLAG